MARFNKSTVGKNKTVNYEGEPAHRAHTPELELLILTSSTLLQGNYYESADERVSRILDLVPQCDPAFVNNLAPHLRHKMYLRSVPLLIVAALAKTGNLKDDTVDRVIGRADEITELAAVYESLNKGVLPLSNPIKRGIAKAFNRFNEYHFGKYNRQGRGRFDFRGLLKLTRPKPKDKEQEALFNRIKMRNLATPKTWEVEMSAAGSDKEAKKKIWMDLIGQDTLGYMAMIRNINNFFACNLPDDYWDEVLERIADPERVMKSKQFPFRFYTAARQVSQDHRGNPRLSRILNALNSALSVCARNIPSIDEYKGESFLIASDVSGSMNSPLSKRPRMWRKTGVNFELKYHHVGLVLSATMLSGLENNALTVGVFGTQWAPLAISNVNDILASVKAMKDLHVGLATNAHLVIDWAHSEKYKYDRMFFFSDSQIWDSFGGRHFGNTIKMTSTFSKSLNRYRKDINPDVQTYFFDLEGYGTFPVSTVDRGVHIITGWSDRIFETLQFMEKGEDLVRALKEGGS